MLAVMFFLTNMRPYESDLDTITPEIKTPKAVVSISMDRPAG